MGYKGGRGGGGISEMLGKGRRKKYRRGKGRRGQGEDRKRVLRSSGKSTTLSSSSRIT